MKFSMTEQEKGGLSIQVTELLYFYKDNKMSEFHLLFLHKNNPENCLIIQLNIEDIKVYKIYFVDIKYTDETISTQGPYNLQIREDTIQLTHIKTET